MTRGSLADLDELVLRCRDHRARSYIGEAVACYKAGASRACIVTTWTAVVYDVVHKLRELEMGGDKNAKTKVERYDKIHEDEDIAASLAFERDILDMAKNEFEFISASEHLDLVRLRDDRNRCAHPSMHSGDEPFSPTAELARYHLRNAVDYLLAQPPVQGKAALTRIWAEIASTYFPAHGDLAFKHLSAGPLARARSPLIRGFVIGLTKSLLLDDRPPAERRRQLAALGAGFRLHSGICEQVAHDSLPGIVAGVSDDGWHKVVAYVATVPLAWELLGQAGQIKAREYVANFSIAEHGTVLADAIRVPALEEAARCRLATASVDQLTELTHLGDVPAYTDVVVDRFVKARGYREAAKIGNSLLLPLPSKLTMEQVRNVAEAFVDNSQVTKSWGMPAIMTELFQETMRYADATAAEWQRVYNTLTEDEFDDSGGQLRRLLEEVYPFMDVPF